MSRYYSHFPPYVSVAKRRANAAQAAKKMAKGGRALAPVQMTGRAIARTFWGKSWCANLEAYSDYENRLPRGRSYVRNGSVIDLRLDAGKVSGLVQGSHLYKIEIGIAALPPKAWGQFTRRCAGKVTNLLDLLQGRLSKEILQEIATPGTGLFPAPKEIKLSCSCPDWAEMCKHVAAVLYGVGARLDVQPELFFTLRGVDVQDLITTASATATSSLAGATAADLALTDTDLSALFGVEIESPASAPVPPRKKAAAKKSAPRKQKPGAKPKAVVKKKSARKTTRRKAGSIRP